MLFLLLAGLAGGFISGLLGIGGGVIYVFVLKLTAPYFEVASDLGQYVVANSLFIIFISTLSSVIKLLKNNTFYIKPVFQLSLMSIPTSLVFTLFIVDNKIFTESLFNFICIITLFIVLVKYLLVYKLKDEKEQIQNRNVFQKNFFLSGIAAGAMCALTGLGGGTILNPILNLYFKLDVKTTKSISLGVIMFSTLFISILNLFLNPIHLKTQFSLGYLNFTHTLPIIIGTMCSTFHGINYSIRLSEKKSLKIFILCIFFFLIKYIFYN